MAKAFDCPTCGRRHEALSRDHGFTLPDEVWALPEEERES